MARTYDEFGNVIEYVTADELINQQNAEFAAMGGADDDSGSPTTYYENDGTASSTAAETVYYENDGSGSTASGGFTPGSSSGSTPTLAGTTISGKSDTPGASKVSTKPGKRTFNPLGNFSSFTYQLSLYMITPDAYDAFIQSGRSNINAIANTGGNAAAAASFNNTGAGVYLVAQSGGINNNNSLRAPGFDLDFYIDDLQIKTHTNAQSSGTSSNSSDIKFKIYEPYGFSFVTKLATAAQMLQQYSNTLNYKNMDNPSKQFFILGVRFQGYDEQGNPVTANTADMLGQTGGNNGAFERFYDIIIKSIKFKLDGKATTYSIEATSLAPQTALSLKRGVIGTEVTAVASTFEEALVGDGPGVQGIFTQLNEQQKDLLKAKAIEIPNVYKIKFIGSDSDLLKNASLLSPSDIKDKTKQSMGNIKDSAQVNTAVSIKASPNKNTKQVIFKSATPIPQAVQLIVSQSDFVEKALKVLYTTEAEPNPETDQPDTVKGGNRTLKWYNMSTEVKNLGFDMLTKDFAYEITYVFQTYETPSVIAFAGGKQTPYYGPHKKYSYWFSGDNREILDYTQTLDNTYFNTAIEPLPDVKATIGGSNDVPLAAYKRQSVARQGRSGQGAEAGNSYVNYLMDPSAQAKATLTILGDPDFLIQDNSSSINSLYNRFYGTDGFTINPNGGQVYIELDFNEAIDYNNQTGLMDINKRVQFGFRYPPALKIKGLCWMVVTVNSNFKGGKFTQQLECVSPAFADLNFTNSQQRESSNTLTGQRTATMNSSGTTNTSQSKSVGLVAAPESTGPSEADLAEADQADQYYNGNTQQTSPTGGGAETSPVADDDSSSVTTYYENDGTPSDQRESMDWFV